MAKQTPKQKKIVERVMHEFKTGDLEQRDGEPVKDRKQAIAIALSESGSTNRKSPAQNRKALRTTEKREKTEDGEGQSRDALYAEARRRAIPGRSTMSKAQLERALGR